jgi:predicted lipoprotein with Yx(FWY)xxD motif
MTTIRSRTVPGLLAAALLLSAGAVQAQPVDLPIPPATTDQFPPGVHIAKTAQGSVYVDRRGHVLYGMDMRTLLRAGPDPSRYCQDACAQSWEPLLAPGTAAPNIRFPMGNRESAPTRPTGP